jgi:hypothetical protein
MKTMAVSWQRRLAALLWGCLIAAPALTQSLEVIDLRHRTAQEVIPVLQPLLEPGGALSGNDYKLFVRASAGNIAQLKQVLAQLDTEPRQLLISVRHATRQTIEREAAAASVAIGDGHSSASVLATDASVQGHNDGVASVQVLEGNAAYIATGQSIPIVTAVAAGGHRPWLAASTAYHDVNSGFMVTPRVAGQRVMLNIEQQAQQVAGNTSSIQTQSIATQVSGTLNQWISLGGVRELAETRSRDILSRQYSTQSDSLDVWVKVEER